MGVGAGLFNMTQVPAKTMDSLIPPAREISLVEAYSRSATQDKLMAARF